MLKGGVFCGASVGNKPPSDPSATLSQSWRKEPFLTSGHGPLSGTS